MVRTRRQALLALACVLWLGTAQTRVVAQETTPNSETKVARTTQPKSRDKATGKAAKAADASASPSSTRGLISLARAANPMLWPLVICSIVALGFTLERMVALRRGRVIPADFVERFLERLSGGKLDRDRALELCKAHEGPMARVFAVIVSQWGQPPHAIRQAVAQEAAGEVADLKRNVRALNATATLAPLLGLLGTVIGLIEAFEALGGPAVDGLSKSERLAHGISLALMATAAGLAIAVFSVAAYYYLLHRIDILVRDMDENARRAVDLVAAEPTLAVVGRPAADRRPMGTHDLPRAEGRTLGRSEPL
jgi:biopolymer transport protein ExbB